MHTQPSDKLTRDGLLAAYEGYCAPRERFLVGGEFERHLLRPDGHPVPYFGEHGVLWLLERMMARGWAPYHEGEHLIALKRDAAWITLEPGGQFELSGAPFRHVGEVVAQARSFIQEVQAAIGDEPIHQVALGFTPYARIEDIPWVPKGRYAVMKSYLGRTGKLAHHMMKGTAAVQASYDFSSEADCAAKVRMSVLLGPLTTAIFANSPLLVGAPSGWASWRGHVWTQTDPARTGFPEAALAFSFERWVDYLLDVPMMFTQIGGAWRDAGGRTFRDWMDRGIDGTYPSEADWDLHLTSVFPEVRIKRQLEVRGADCVPMPLAAGFVALFKGLFYCDRALSDATELAERFARHGSQWERFDAACRDGLRGHVGGRSLAAWAEELLELATGGIARCDPDDLPWMEPLVDQVARGESPADEILRAWHRNPDPAAFLGVIAYHP